MPAGSHERDTGEPARAMPITAWKHMHFTGEQVGRSTKSPRYTHRARTAHSTPSWGRPAGEVQLHALADHLRTQNSAEQCGGLIAILRARVWWWWGVGRGIIAFRSPARCTGPRHQHGSFTGLSRFRQQRNSATSWGRGGGGGGEIGRGPRPALEGGVMGGRGAWGRGSGTQKLVH